MSRTNVKTARPQIFTHEGAPARHINPVQQLRRLVLPCLLWEDGFYVDGKTVAEQIAEAVRNTDADTAYSVALEAREAYHLRHVPLWIVREMARSHQGSSIVSRAIEAVVQRPDEAGEFLSLYWKLPGWVRDFKSGAVAVEKPTKRHHGKGQALSAQVKKGLARAFAKFDRYQLAKYAGGSAAVKLRDVLFLTHANPRLLTQASGLEDGRADTFKALAENKLGASDAGTWEARLSSGESKKETFADLLAQNKLGYLALLRNLRNMVDSGVDRDLINTALLARKGARHVLPFRYVAAARAVPQLEPVIDQALCAAIAESRPLPGTTWVLVDVSGSMDDKLSGHSDLTRMDAACTLASIIPGTVRMFSFSNALMECPPRRGMAGVDSLRGSQSHGATYLGDAVARINALMSNNGLNDPALNRLIVITDEQSHDRVPDPWARHAYMINVAPNKNGVGYGRWTHIDGFSEAVLRFIWELERGQPSFHESK